MRNYNQKIGKFIGIVSGTIIIVLLNPFSLESFVWSRHLLWGSVGRDFTEALKFFSEPLALIFQVLFYGHVAFISVNITGGLWCVLKGIIHAKSISQKKSAAKEAVRVIGAILTLYAVSFYYAFTN